MSTSSAVTAGTNATATQYNNLRTDAITRYVRFYFEIQGSLVTGTGLGTITVPVSGSSMTVTKIKHKIVSGTSATVTVKVNSSTIKSGITATTTYADETASLSNTSLADGDELVVDITGVSGSPSTLRVLIFATEVI
jgi:hypothetical protein